MGINQSKNHVAIIDKKLKMQLFKSMTSDKRFSCSFYQDFASFLQKQSLKKIQHVIIAQHNPDQHQFHHDLQFDLHAESSRFNHKNRTSNKQSPKNQLLSYIKRYSEEHINIYLLVPQISSYKLQNYQFPYITLLSEKIQMIQDYILHAKQQQHGDGGTVNIKLKRMIRDLYRKLMVKVIHPQYSENKKDKDKAKQKDKDKQQNQKTKQEKPNQAQYFIKEFKKHSVSYEMFRTHADFSSTNISTYIYYLICLPQDLLQAIQFRKTNQFEYKIIVFGQKQEVSTQKAYKVWLISNDLPTIIEKMKKCSNISSQQKSIPSQNTIIYSYTPLFTENYELIQEKIIEKMGKQLVRKYNIRFAKDTKNLFEMCDQDQYSYVICFSSTQEVMESTRIKIRQKGYHTRLHLAGLQQFPREPEQKQIDLKIKYLCDQIKFQIKFQVSPLENITLFSLDDNVVKFFKNKMGLSVDYIKDMKQFDEFYKPPNYKRIIDSYHFVCSFHDYYNIFKRIFQGQQYQDTYLSKIKIIILDSKKVIEKAIVQNLLGRSVVQIHHNLNNIKTYIEYAETQKVSMPFFAKHALTKFTEVGAQINNAHANGYLCMRCSLNSRNQLFKEIFQSDFKINKQYFVNFLRFPARDRNSQTQIAKYQEVFLLRYANLWRVGYDILSPENFLILKDDIKKLFFKCKNYDLLKVSDEEFQYFYIKKIDDCRSFLELQILCIYIYSLPHGMNQFIVDVFRRPRMCCLAIKYFVHYIVTIFTAFCSFDDQIMSFKSLVLYLTDADLKHYLSRLQPGDILYNISFMNCFRNQDPEQNQRNHCLIFQLENIPFMSKTKIKNLLEIQRFSFYKESTEFLAAPYTKFQIKSVKLKNKFYQIRVAAVDDHLNNGFINKIFQVNGITEHDFATYIQKQINSKNGIISKYSKIDLNQLKNQESLYKKAEVLSLHQQKVGLIDQIRQGLQYYKFFEANTQQKYFTAEHFLQIKGQSRKQMVKSKNKNLVDIQQHHMSQMLQVQKALVAYNMSKYSESIKYLRNVQDYLFKQKTQDLDSWRIERIRLIKQQVQDYWNHRRKLMDQSKHFKKWTVKPQLQGEKLECQPEEHAEKWMVDFHQQYEKFYICNQKEPNKMMIPAKPQSTFGVQFIPFMQAPLYDYLEIRKFYNSSGVESLISGMFQDLTKNQQKQQNRNKKGKNIIQVSPRRQKSPRKQKSPAKQQKNKTQQDLQGPFGGLFEGIIDQKQNPNTIKKQQKSSRSQRDFVLNKSVLFLQQQSKKQIQSEKNKKSNFSNEDKRRQQVFNIQNQLKIDMKIEWQVFYYDGKFKLVQKGKRFKAKIHPDNNRMKSQITKNRMYVNSQGNWIVQQPSKMKENNFV